MKRALWFSKCPCMTSTHSAVIQTPSGAMQRWKTCLKWPTSANQTHHRCTSRYAINSTNCALTFSTAWFHRAHSQTKSVTRSMHSTNIRRETYDITTKNLLGNFSVALCVLSGHRVFTDMAVCAHGIPVWCVLAGRHRHLALPTTESQR